MKFPLTQWSHSHPKGLSTGSRVGVEAGQGLRLEAQVLQASGPWSSQQAVCHGVELGVQRKAGYGGPWRGGVE